MPASRAKWLRNPDGDEPQTIEAEFDGVMMFVPRDENNRHYQELMTQVTEDGLVIDDPDPEPVIVPQEVPKLALVRAMRMITLGGEPAANASQSAWSVVRQSLTQAPTATQEDWEMVTMVNRQDDLIHTFVATLPFPDGTDPDAVMDKLYRVADLIDRRAPKAEIDAAVAA